MIALFWDGGSTICCVEGEDSTSLFNLVDKAAKEKGLDYSTMTVRMFQNRKAMTDVFQELSNDAFALAGTLSHDEYINSYYVNLKRLNREISRLIEGMFHVIHDMTPGEETANCESKPPLRCIQGNRTKSRLSSHG